MNFNKLGNHRIDNLILRGIKETDSEFISKMFHDDLVKKYYIVPKEAQQDYKKLVSYWLEDISQEAGYAWIIYEKSTGLFSKEKPCGFFAFEFRNSLSNARISYALRPEYRNKGITIKTATFVIDLLRSLGVTTFEADIDEDNIASEKVITKLGFTTNKHVALIDPEMMRDDKIRIRFLWKRDFSEKPIIKENVRSSQNLGNESAIDLWINKIFLGSQFNNWVYDESEPIKELKKKGYPFTMACFEVDRDILISVGMDRSDQTPKTFIAENQQNSFVLDLSIPPKKLDTIHGKRTIYYAKKV